MTPEEIMKKLEELRSLVEKDQSIRPTNCWDAMRKKTVQEKIENIFDELLSPA